MYRIHNYLDKGTWWDGMAARRSTAHESKGQPPMTLALFFFILTDTNQHCCQISHPDDCFTLPQRKRYFCEIVAGANEVWTIIWSGLTIHWFGSTYLSSSIDLIRKRIISNYFCPCNLLILAAWETSFFSHSSKNVPATTNLNFAMEIDLSQLLIPRWNGSPRK